MPSQPRSTSSQDGWKNRFRSITLYQQGWRLGGKGASGRGDGQRIEEHGLHIWFGFYENAFRMLSRCHQDLDRRAAAGTPRWPLAFQTIDDSFRRCVQIALTDYDECDWKLWVADFFDDWHDTPWAEPDPRPPGERPEDWTVVFYVVRCLRLAADLAWSLVESDSELEIVEEPAAEAHGTLNDLDDAFHTLWALVTGDVRTILNAAADIIDALGESFIRQRFVLSVLDLVLRALDLVTEYMRRRYDSLVRSSDAARRAWYVVDMLIAIARGVIEDGVIEEGSFAVIDDIDFREWLLAHGAARETVDCALVRAVVYDLAFAFEDGDPQRPSCGAGTALRGLLRTFFTYRGALMWKMNASMGDVVFAPLYELLRKREVEVQFFHRVEAVEANAAGDGVEKIVIDVQADLADNLSPAAFLGLTPGAAPGTKAVWPSKPPAAVLKGDKYKAIPAADYESWYMGREAAKSKTIELRRGQDADGFEEVVFGLPIGCVPYVAPDLEAKSKRWARAVQHVLTVPTQAMQLWLDRDASELGAARGAVVGGFVEPFDTWADMEHLVGQEAVKDAKTVAYFCNALADRPPPERGDAKEWLAERGLLVHANAMRFLTRDVGILWPDAVNPLTKQFHWDWLVDASGAAGPDRLNAQYLRANVEPSERYVLSVPGSSAHRIPPADTGFENLFAVGDWTSCMLDAGCVEAAVISGIRAANGIHRKYQSFENVQAIVGEDHP